MTNEYSKKQQQLFVMEKWMKYSINRILFRRWFGLNYTIFVFFLSFVSISVYIVFVGAIKSISAVSNEIYNKIKSFFIFILLRDFCASANVFAVAFTNL